MFIKPLLRKKAYMMICILAFIGIMIASTLLISPVKANPISVSVSPTSGTPGTSVSVSGNDATPHGEVRVYLSVFFFSLFMETTTANGAGIGSASEPGFGALTWMNHRIFGRSMTGSWLATLPLR